MCLLFVILGRVRVKEYNFLKFIKYYFNVCELSVFKSRPDMDFKKLFRIFLIVFGYSLITLGIMAVCIQKNYKIKYIVFIAFIFLGTIILFITEFSFVYYFLVYLSYKNRTKNYNREIIYNTYINAKNTVDNIFDLDLLNSRDTSSYLAFATFTFSYKNKAVVIKVKKNCCYFNKVKICKKPFESKEEFQHILINNLMRL
jgi:hypothetical protein